MVLAILILVVLWRLLHLGLTKPVLNHLTGTRQDLSAFEDLLGNLSDQLVYLALTWSLAVFGEEIVYRGCLQRRLRDVFVAQRPGLILSVGIS